jgi:hypothetical protein
MRSMQVPSSCEDDEEQPGNLAIRLDAKPWTGHDRTRQDTAGQGGTGGDRRGQDGARRDTTGQDGTGGDMAGQEGTGRDRTGHDGTRAT